MWWELKAGWGQEAASYRWKDITTTSVGEVTELLSFD